MTTQAQAHVTRASEQDHLFTLDPTRTYPVLDRADGVHVWDTDGNQYLDAVSGLGVVNIGYGRREVADAMAAQAAKMPFNAGNIFSNEPAIALANRIAELAPGDLNYVHFTSGGSEAVEVALKMARQYHVERGEPERDKVIGRWTSYHGATLGGLSVGGAVLRRAKYEPMLLDMPHIPPIYCYRCPWGLTYPSCQVTCADELEREILRVGPGRVAAFIAEPIVASVGGAIQPQPEYFPKIREICDRYGVLLIVDEVITGFGRTGRMFGIEHYGVVPDLMVMGKGISSGYAPLAAVAVREHVRQAFVQKGVAFEHIFTYGGHSVSTAAGIAAVDILRPRAAHRARRGTRAGARRHAPGPSRVPDRRRRADDRLHGRHRVRGRPRDARPVPAGIQGGGPRSRGRPSARHRDVPGNGDGRRWQRRHHLALPAAHVHRWTTSPTWATASARPSRT